MRRLMPFLAAHCFALAIMSVCVAAEPPVLRIPARTAYSEPDASANIAEGRRTKAWTNPRDNLAWYGRFAAQGVLHASVEMRLPAGQSVRLKIAVGRQTRAAAVSGADGPVSADFGEFRIERTGYVRFALSALSKTGEAYGTPTALVLSGPAAADAHFSMVERRNAASVHLSYPTPRGAVVTSFYNEVTVRADPTSSFYMACGFSRGYFGIQVNSPTERRIIFSVWDSGNEAVDRSKVTSADRVQLLAKGEGVVANDFGNEGTGGHSHLVYPWRKGTTYRFLLTAAPEDKTTVYTAWFWFAARSRWGLIASFRAPKDGDGLRGLHSFNENFWGDNGQRRRLAEYGPQWVRTEDGRWRELLEARFTHDPHGKEQRLDYAAAPLGSRFLLSNGGFVGEGVKYGDRFTRKPARKAPVGVGPEEDPNARPVQSGHVSLAIDTSAAPDVAQWAEASRKTCEAFYPTITRMLATPGYVPPSRVQVKFEVMDGVAGTAGTRIFVSADWVRKHPEDVGMLVHELVHAVQAYPTYDAGWLVEGIADYIRWKVFEPKSNMGRIDPARAKHTDGYRTTAGFLDWIVRNRDKAIIGKLNAALRTGKYRDTLFREYTGSSLEELWASFRATL